jgi:hypothetical protein
MALSAHQKITCSRRNTLAAPLMNNSLLVGVVVARYKANIIISSFTAGNPHFRPACPYYRSAVYVTFLKYIFFKTSGVKSSEDFPAVFRREQVIF